MKKLILIFVINLSLITFINAQTEVDALRYSYMNISGTGRYIGMGGAFGAIGADFSALSTNPAGIGLYRSNEFTFTPSFYEASTSSSYMGNSNSDNKYNFNFGNLGLISANQSNKGKWRYIQFGIGLNRLGNFNNRMIIEGYNSKSSLMTEWAQFAQGNNYANLNQWDTQLAFDAYLIDTVKNKPTEYRTYLNDGNVLQRKSATYKGSTNELVFSMGGNYDDRLYIGGTIGIPFINYSESSDYSESDINDKVYDVKNYTLTDKLDETGVGFNLKLGLIYRVNDWVRLGAAFHTPTFYKINRTDKRTIQSNFDNGDYSPVISSPKADFNYHLETPMTASGSIAFVIGKIGLLGIDYEYADYSGMKFRDDSKDQYDYSSMNKDISSIYTAQHNLKAGAEVRLEPVYIRAGFGLSTSPYADSKLDNLDERKSVSFGIGFRDAHRFFDIGFMRTFYKQDYYFYNPYLVDASSNSISNNILAFTIGFKF